MSELLVTRDSGIVQLELNRPARRHALSLSLLRELEAALGELREDRSARVAVVCSSGNVFCSGHDLGEMTGRSAEDYQELFATCSRVMLGLRQLPIPVIARVQGLATAAGCQLVAACDLAVAAEIARFATPGVKIGLFCTTPMVPLVRSVAPKVAMEMLLTGQPLSAQQALAAGLVNRVVPEAELDSVVAEWTTAIVQSSPLTLAIGKRAFYDQLPLSEAAAYEQAVCVMTDNALRHDAQEGISAFLQKRTARWTGE
jgi:enoyl-CoA hydratase/carnithine racemase